MERVEVHRDKTELARAAFAHILALADTAITRQGRFNLALAGGSTPEQTYSLLAAAHLDWSKIHLFWGDERCVPPDHPDSNYRMVRLALLDHIDISPENVHRIRGELPPRQAAVEYERILQGFFTPESSFDLVLLGMGADGHTASLFPGAPALAAQQRWVAVVPHDNPPPPLVDRISLTLPAINAARQATFLVAGADKAACLKQVLSAPPAAKPRFPVQYVRLDHNPPLWLIDRAAAGY